MGRKLERDTFEQLVGAVTSCLPNRVSAEPVRLSLFALLGSTFDQTVWRDFAWRLAGNLDSLRRGQHVLPVQRVQDVWLPLEVMYAMSQRGRDGLYGVDCQFRVLAGPACPLVFNRFLSARTVRYFRVAFGFSKFHRDPELRQLRGRKVVSSFPFQDVRQIFGLRVWAWAGRPKEESRGIEFGRLESSSAFLKYNREILAARLKLLPPCPLSLSTPCWECPVGRDRCRAACRPRSLVRQVCANCRREVWCEPGGRKPGWCLACLEPPSLNRKEK